MGQRIYKYVIDRLAMTNNVQDLISLKAGANNGIELHQIRLSISTVTSPTDLPLRLKRMTGTLTAGSGGAAATAANQNAADDGDTKSDPTTIRIGDTTQATCTNTVQLLDSQIWDTLFGYDYLPAPEDREACQAGEQFVIDLPVAPGAGFTLSGQVAYRVLP